MGLSVKLADKRSNNGMGGAENGALFWLFVSRALIRSYPLAHALPALYQHLPGLAPKSNFRNSIQTHSRSPLSRPRPNLNSTLSLFPTRLAYKLLHLPALSFLPASSLHAHSHSFTQPSQPGASTSNNYNLRQGYQFDHQQHSQQQSPQTSTNHSHTAFATLLYSQQPFNQHSNQTSDPNASLVRRTYSDFTF